MKEWIGLVSYMDMPEINLGQYPKRTFEDLRLQTRASLNACSPAYFYVYPSHPGIVIRQLHHLLTSLTFNLRMSSGIRGLVWGRAGDIAHIDKYLGTKGLWKNKLHELHGVVSCPDDEDWVRSQVANADVWCDDRLDGYVRPPAPQHHFNCVIVMGEHRRECLEASYEYVDKDSTHMVIAVDDEISPYCSEFDGRFCLGGPVWRGE